MSGDGNATVNKTVNAMMVNFMYQLDQAEECPSSWQNSISGVSVRVPLEEIGIWISRLSKEE